MPRRCGLIVIIRMGIADAERASVGIYRSARAVRDLFRVIGKKVSTLVWIYREKGNTVSVNFFYFFRFGSFLILMYIGELKKLEFA